MTDMSEKMSMTAEERDGRDSSVGSTKYRDEDWLREKYHSEGLLMSDIADICDCSLSTIQTWINKHEIESKTQSEIQGESDDLRYTDEDWLRKQYYGEERSEPEIADDCRVSQGTVHVWMEKHGIERRSRSESQKVAITEEWLEAHSERMSGESHPMYGVRGEEHPLYEGGYDGDWRLGNRWQRIRKQVWERDNYTCQWCGDDGKLHAHHLIRVADGGEKYDMENIITLCEGCHHEVHSNNSEVFFSCH